MNDGGLSLVTCSYAPDFERCERLCRSVERHCDASIPHLLLVPQRDTRLFAKLAGGRVRVVPVQSLLPKWLWQLPGFRKWWVTPFTPPVRGWILQQIVKLSVSAVAETEAVTFVDSDVVMIRRFDADALRRDGRWRLLRQEGHAADGRHLNWHRASAELLGLPPRDYFGSDYIGVFATWTMDNLRKLHDHLEARHGRPWPLTLCRRLDLSEYILYGVFVEHVLGDAPGHFHDDRPLSHNSWGFDLDTPAGRDAYVERVGPQAVAALVQSNLGLDAHATAALLDRVAQRVANEQATSAGPRAGALATDSAS